jgi:hypothetical protein
MVEWATEIKVRAERRAGQLLKETAERGERATRGVNVERYDIEKPTLSDLGISRDQSNKWQKLAASASRRRG